MFYKNNAEKDQMAYNANREAVEIILPSKGPWKVLVDVERAGSKVLYVFHDNKMKVPVFSSFVLKTKKLIK